MPHSILAPAMGAWGTTTYVLVLLACTAVMSQEPVYYGMPLLPLNRETLVTYLYDGVVDVDWTNVLAQSNTTATLQVVVNPLIMRNSPIHSAGLASVCSTMI